MTAAVAMVTASPLLLLLLLALAATAHGRALQEEPVEIDVHVVRARKFSSRDSVQQRPICSEDLK